MRRLATTLRRSIGDTCCICGRYFRADSTDPICRECRRSVQAYRGPACPRCGRPTSVMVDMCSRCRDRLEEPQAPGSPAPDRFGPVVAIHVHSGAVAKLIQAYKLTPRPSLATYFADEVFRVLSVHFPEFTVVPVPGSFRGRQRRGFDQVERITDHLRLLYDVSVNGCLRRDQRARAQKHLTAAARENNLDGHIHIRRGAPIPELAVLLDDVTTTGATFRACAATLLRHGTQRCGAVALAIEL